MQRQPPAPLYKGKSFRDTAAPEYVLTALSDPDRFGDIQMEGQHGAFKMPLKALTRYYTEIKEDQT